MGGPFERIIDFSYAGGELAQAGGINEYAP